MHEGCKSMPASRKIRTLHGLRCCHDFDPACTYTFTISTTRSNIRNRGYSEDEIGTRHTCCERFCSTTTLLPLSALTLTWDNAIPIGFGKLILSFSATMAP